LAPLRIVHPPWTMEQGGRKDRKADKFQHAALAARALMSPLWPSFL
jgi:hypothetical protein